MFFVCRADEANGNMYTVAKCYPWVTRNDKNKLDISTPKLFQYPAVRSCKFVNLVTILGPARQGKSFLMNCLMGESLFKTSDAFAVCTKGVQIANMMHQVGDGGYAFFVDTEGQGNEDADTDITLLTPILLSSKVILFNWKGGLQINQILNELAILVKIAKCVSSKCFEENFKFGHLNIVLRDFHFQGMYLFIY